MNCDGSRLRVNKVCLFYSATVVDMTDGSRWQLWQSIVDGSTQFACTVICKHHVWTCATNKLTISACQAIWVISWWDTRPYINTN